MTPEEPNDKTATEGLLEYYKEQLAHGRHLDVQRSTIATLSFAFSGAIIGHVLGDFTRAALPYTIALFAVGSIAMLLSAKLYERFRLHNEVAKFARDKLNPGLATFRKQAEAVNRKEFPLLFCLQLHVIWNVLFGIIMACGAISTVILFSRCSLEH